MFTKSPRSIHVYTGNIFIGIKVFVAGGDSSNCDDGGGRRKLKSEIVHVFQSKSEDQFNEITFIWSETVPSFPGFDVFGGSVKKKVVVGNGKSVLEYNVEDNGWNVLQSTTKDREDGSAMCAIDDTNLVLSGGKKNGDTLEILSFYDYNDTNSLSGSLNSLYQNLRPSLSAWSLCKTRLPIDVSHHTLVKIGHKKVLLAGGLVNNLQPSNRVFEGTFQEKDKDVIWKDLKSLKRSRQSHICFKLGKNIYVAGGQGSEAHEILSCCEVYNLDHKKWNRSYLKLPYSLYDASVVVDPDETFALITGNFSLTSGGSNKVITFTEQNGFSVFDRFALKIPRFGHVSTIIE